MGVPKGPLCLRLYLSTCGSTCGAAGASGRPRDATSLLPVTLEGQRHRDHALFALPEAQLP
ncbi:hypothetical protein FDG2_1294 [Candidatus Protofrankia californiensis]|uniref:Uncharacterized protein n=1 Tax=Candidatus Protofrankia californiensis TaxID=1839754 RepID=A0A1C3NVB2_9ACTN|nr:hypothetical protein FDG2_1294 [Candidatus Protofrankia californiensis]